MEVPSSTARHSFRISNFTPLGLYRLGQGLLA
jgi:hypothetical protein